MSKVKPELISPSTLLGIDSVVNALQTILLNIKYVNIDGEQDYFNGGLMLPLVEYDESTKKPIAYWKGKDYFPASLNDNYRSNTYFYQEDPNNAAGLNESTYKLNIVHWYNQDKFIRNSGLIKEAVIAQFKKTLINYLRLENKSSINIFRETDSIFSRFELKIRTNMKYPWNAFRIQFEVTVENDCYTNLINLENG